MLTELRNVECEIAFIRFPQNNYLILSFVSLVPLLHYIKDNKCHKTNIVSPSHSFAFLMTGKNSDSQLTAKPTRIISITLFIKTLV